jgi:outer membrane receptor protein involved in Fe transport
MTRIKTNIKHRRAIGAAFSLTRTICIPAMLAAPLAAPMVAHAQAAPASLTAQESQLSSITVTAQKRAERLTQVPVSAMAFDQDALDKQGVKDIADIARLVPGVTFQGNDDSGNMNIAIRGIISTVGAATTGIYVDDVPVQVRQNSAMWSNPYPKIFDLDRIEVLRGPQGTLFGAGSEGGAIRFITPEASLYKSSGYASSDLAITRRGDPSWEAGGAVGGPIVEGKLGFRASVWQREEGGYAKRQDPATGAQLSNKGNGNQATAFHLNLKYAPTENLTITPGVFYQQSHHDDQGLFEEAAGTYTVSSRIAQPHNDRFLLSTLGVNYDFGSFSFKSISSYIDRKVTEEYDSTAYELTSFVGDTTVPFDPNYLVVAHYRSVQQGVTQELRLTSNDDPKDRLSWVAGLFYQRSKAGYYPLYQDNNLDALANYLSTTAGTGPADSASYFGEAPVNGLYSYVSKSMATETGLAAYGNLSYAITPTLKVSGGVRVSRDSFSYDNNSDGPWGPGAPYHTEGAQSQKPVTPRFNVAYQIDPERMVYASAAKGYRIGGANELLPASCNGDLASLGLSHSPDTYKSDSLWSYEAGLKGRFLDNTLLIESSVYWIDWSQIQQSIYLSTCGYNFIGNLGQATSRGFDVQAKWAPVKHLVLSGTAGLTDAKFTKTLRQDTQVLAKQGDPLATPKWTFTAGIEYGFAAWDGAAGYTRLDYEFNGGYRRSGSDEVFGSDPVTRDAPAVRLASARVGARFGQWDASVYVNNLFNDSTSLYRVRSSGTATNLRDSRLQPMAAGVSARYKF